MSKAPSGFHCKTCGKRHPFGVWVLAHWDTALTHTCECGAKHRVQRGCVTQIRKGKRATA